MTNPLGIDLAIVDQAEYRLERALELVRTIGTAARELAEFIDDPDDPVAKLPLELVAANGAGPPATLAPPPAEDVNDAGASRPPPAAPTSRRRNRAGEPRRASKASVDATLDYLEAHPGEWLSMGGICKAVSLSITTARAALEELLSTGTAEHNGRSTSARRWRLDPGLVAELEGPNDGDPDTDDGDGIDEARGQDGQPDPGAGDTAHADVEPEEEDDPKAAGRSPAAPSSTAPPAPPSVDSSSTSDEDDDPVDVKAELERLSGLAPPRRSAARPPQRPSGAGILGSRHALEGPQGPAREALKARIRDVLLTEAHTTSDLAIALDVPRRDVAPVLAELVADPDDPIVEAGIASGRRETGYVNVA